jgi:hypothetical protein
MIWRIFVYIKYPTANEINVSVAAAGMSKRLAGKCYRNAILETLQDEQVHYSAYLSCHGDNT